MTIARYGDDDSLRRAITWLGDVTHDVGKRLSRAARNVPPTGAIAEPLALMLERDAFGRGEERTAHEALRSYEPWPGAPDDARMLDVRAKLEVLDGHREAVRARDERAVRETARLALEIGDALRAMLSEARTIAAERGLPDDDEDDDR